MFRDLRRKKQLLPEEMTFKILKEHTHGILGVIGDDGYPYTVPVSHMYANGKIYFHGAKSGHKLDAIKKNPKVSFTVVDRDDVKPEEFTTYFRSVIAFGTARIITGSEEIFKVMDLIDEKFASAFKEKGREQIAKEMSALAVVEIEIEHITGKEAMKLVKLRETSGK